MKIGIFSECYNPVLNGVVVSINTFKTELEKRGHEYYIFTTDCLGKALENEDKIIRFPIMLPFKPKGGKYPIAWPPNSNKVARKTAELKIDLIHSQHLLGLGKTGLKVAKRLNIPSILTYHTLLAEYAHYSPIFRGTVKNYLIRQSRKYCNLYDQLITPSSVMADVLKSYGVTRPIEPIATGVQIDEFNNPFLRKTLEEKWQVPPDKKLLLYISRIAKEKNVDFLFEAIEVLAKKRNDFFLLLVGGGPELELYQQKVKSGLLSGKVAFTGMQPKEETVKFFGAADIFVFPSFTETQGIVITEAMAAGIPAVAVNKMGPSEIIENGVDGYLTDLKIDDFTDRIEDLLNNEEKRTKMGIAAKQNAEKYSVARMADKMENLYEKVANNYRS